MQQKILQPTWEFQDFNIKAMDSIFDDHHHPGFFSSFTTTEISVESLLTSMLSDQETMEFTSPGIVIPSSSVPIPKEEGISSFAIEEVCKWLISDDYEQHMQSPCSTLEYESSGNNLEVILTFPGHLLDTNSQGNLHHLINAYGEATENGLSGLKDVISQRILEKISPIGEATDRVAFHLLQESEEANSYLKQESRKNIELALDVFYQSLPYGKFAHYIANQSILDSIPDDVDKMNIIDFDIRDGTQWSKVIEIVAAKNILELRIITIGLEENEDGPSPWKLEETERRLFQLAKTCGLRLKVERIRLDSLMTELRRTKKTSRGKEWTAFNCMVGLPHMGRRRSRIEAMQFLFTAKVFLSDYANRRGIITFGDGETGECVRPSCSYASFFSNHFIHYQTYFESMEMSFPVHLRDARITMESLFLSPFVSPSSWFQYWKDTIQISNLHDKIGLDGCKMSKESIMKAKMMVNEANSLYTVKLEGQELNEMVLGWRGTPLVRVSTWI